MARLTALARACTRTLCLLTLGLAAQPSLAADALPAPRNADGRMLLSNAAGEPGGIWVPDYRRREPMFVVDDIAFKPWAKGLFDARQAHDLEPHARCKASGAIRQLLTPYGVELLELPELLEAILDPPVTVGEADVEGGPK
jgi:hypothetical protein